MFKKILIANRGEIAVRIIQTCKDMGISTVAVYSTVDQDSLHVKLADSAICIGPPKSEDSYSNYARIISAAKIANVDAIHPGYGFLAENAEFAEKCEEYNIKFIGPSASVITKMGNKSNAKVLVSGLGVPIIPGSDASLQHIELSQAIANSIGYPIILKAVAGGGGRGMRIVERRDQLGKALNESAREAKAFFGDSSLYMEKLVEDAKHVEIQFAADQYGEVTILHERECSIQRRHQKLFEESPCMVLADHTRRKMGEVTKKIAKLVEYEGAGTVEFLLDKNYKDFYFMEMNTRIQVEHAVTEELLGIDLIRMQIEIANGNELESDVVYNVDYSKWVMECRINAEDPYNYFSSSPGMVTEFNKPGGLGVRVDSHVYAGYTIPPHYDSMIAKLIVSAPDRMKCIQRMKRALSEFRIEGVKTTIPFHLELMDNKDFKNGYFTTNFMETFNWK